MLTEHPSFLKDVVENPFADLPRCVYADWLDENRIERFPAGVTKDIDLPALLDDYDWEEVFGEGTGGNTDKETDVCPPGSRIDNTAPSRKDVAEVLAAVNGENETEDWVGIFRLKDGRFLLASGGCDYTGWD